MMSVLTCETVPCLYGETADTYGHMLKEIAETGPCMETLHEVALFIDPAVERRVRS